MMNLRNCVTLVCLLSLYNFSHAQQKANIIAKGAKPILIYDQYSFTEGPAVDSEGNVFFTDQPNDQIIKWSTDGSLSIYMEGTGRSNGLYFDKDDNLIACADLKNELWLIDKFKRVTVLVKEFEGKKLNAPNDLWIAPNGGIYFTDPFYKRNYWTRTEMELEKMDVYYLSPDRKTLTVAASNLKTPNGIVGTADGKKLYVADIGDGKTYSYTINADGTLANRKLFCETGSDGMTLDNKGNVYLTGKGVTVFNETGQQIEHIPIDEKWTANVCFGGANRKTLFITASKSVYTLDMKVKGVQ